MTKSEATSFRCFDHSSFPRHSAFVIARGDSLNPAQMIDATSAIKRGDAINHVSLRFSRNLRINRERQRLARSTFALWKITLLVAEISKTFLLVKCERVVNRRLDLAFAQVLTQSIAHRCANDILMINVMIR